MCKYSNKWKSEINVAGNRYILGLYENKQEAGFIYEFFAFAFHKEFSRITKQFNKFYRPELLQNIKNVVDYYQIHF